jgi:peptide/nickel transport system permease protein
MADFLIRKSLALAATLLSVSLIVFFALELNIQDVAISVLGPYSAPDQRAAWLAEHGYDQPFLWRYLSWLKDFVMGQWGTSIHFREPVLNLLLPNLGHTLTLAGLALLIMVPAALTLGIMAGIEQGSVTDRLVSFLSILTTSIPDFASAVFVSAIFVFWLNWFPGVSSMSEGFSLIELALPLMVLSLFGIGYLARITRASMIEVMQSPYIRTARLKGASTARIVLHHALRNTLIAPVTVIMLYIPWLLSNVIVVEVFFAYKGFGTLLYNASLNHDVYLIETCAMISALVVGATKILSDLAYTWLNPRISLRASGGGR